MIRADGSSNSEATNFNLYKIMNNNSSKELLRKFLAIVYVSSTK